MISALISAVYSLSPTGSAPVSMLIRSSGSVLERRRLKRQSPKSALMPSVGIYPVNADAFKKAVGRKHFFSIDRSWPMSTCRQPGQQN